MQLLDTLEQRRIVFSVDVHKTTFSQPEYIQLLVRLLRSRCCARVGLWQCEALVPEWMRVEAIVLLSHKFNGSCSDDNLPDGDIVEPLSIERRALVSTLVREWLLPCQVCNNVFILADTSVSSP